MEWLVKFRIVGEWIGLARLAGKAWRAKVWMVKACCVRERLGQDWQDRQVALRSVKESLGLFRLGKAGKVWNGTFRSVRDRLGMVKHGRLGGVRLVESWMVQDGYG